MGSPSGQKTTKTKEADKPPSTADLTVSDAPCVFCGGKADKIVKANHIMPGKYAGVCMPCEGKRMVHLAQHGALLPIPAKRKKRLLTN